ncbi:MAG TPA: dimethylsulfonioproprionate lyase family protein [Aestuariivirgaceae bacterium]|jgi:hypothetical protein
MLKLVFFYGFIEKGRASTRGEIVGNEVHADVNWLLKSVTRGLENHQADTPEVGEVLNRLAEQDLTTDAFSLPQPKSLPACTLLPDTVGAALAVASDVAAAIAAVEDDLHWEQNLDYSDSVMERSGFMDGYAYSEIIGPNGFFPGNDFLLGFMLLGPRRLYRERYHAAPELYWMLTGPSNWKRGAGGWEKLAAGSTRWHKPFIVHATETFDTPLLCMWAWTKDVTVPAKLVGT